MRDRPGHETGLARAAPAVVAGRPPHQRRAAAAGAGAELDDEALVAWPPVDRCRPERAESADGRTRSAVSDAGSVPTPPIWCQVLHPAPAQPSHQTAITNR